jgi:hypothetical protein
VSDSNDNSDEFSGISLLDDLGYVENLQNGEQWLISLNTRSIVANYDKIKLLLDEQTPEFGAPGDLAS